MIFKVFCQDSPDEVPIRERTENFYVEAESIEKARKKLIDRNINIEHTQALGEASLAYEQRSESFAVENL